MTRTHVKICGITNLADAEVAVEAGADLLGFILYPKSPRYVPPATVAQIVQALKAHAPRRSQSAIGHSPLPTPHSPLAPPQFVGVFVNEELATISEILAAADLDYAQLHGDEPPALLAQLPGQTYKALRPASAAEAQKQAREFAPLSTIAQGPRWMVDAYDPQAYGGTGHKADWHVAATLARQYPGLLLAGGLTPDNVTVAIQLVQPWGVDVSSGVEAAPGRKDHAKVRAFVERVKSEH